MLTAHGVAWHEIGAGPPVVLCHGLGLDHRDLLPLAGALAAHHRVILWDMPGHGDSQSAPVAGLASLADALATVLADAGVTRPALLGFSLGGVVAQDWLARPGTAARAFIAYACIAPPLRAVVPAGMAAALVWAGWGWRGWDAIRADFARRCALTPVSQQQIMAAMAPLGRARFLALSRALLAAGPRDPGFAMTCPTLLLRGAADSNGPGLAVAAAAMRAACAAPCEEVLIPAASHCAHLDQPDAVAAAVSDFLARY